MPMGAVVYRYVSNHGVQHMQRVSRRELPGGGAEPPGFGISRLLSAHKFVWQVCRGVERVVIQAGPLGELNPTGMH
jgi:hypothetical protein